MRNLALKFSNPPLLNIPFMDDFYKEIDLNIKLNADVKDLLRPENEPRKVFDLEKWDDETFLSQMRVYLESLPSLIEDIQANQQNIRDDLLQLHRQFSHYVLPECDFLIDSQITTCIINILEAGLNDSNIKPDLIFAALYISCDLTRGDKCFVTSLLECNFINIIIKYLKIEHRVMLPYYHNGSMDREKTFSEPILICINNIYLTGNVRSAFTLEDIIVISSECERTTLNRTKMFVVRFFSFYTRDRAVTDEELRSNLMTLCKSLVADALDFFDKQKDQKSPLYQTMMSITKYVGLLLFNLIETNSIDMSCFQDNIDLIQEWIDMSLFFEIEEGVGFLKALINDDNEILNHISMNVDLFFERALSTDNKSAYLYVDILARLIDKTPENVELEGMLAIIDELPKQWIDRSYSQKDILIHFICSFIVNASFDLMTKVEYQPVFAFMEGFIDDSVPDGTFYFILRMLLKFNAFAVELGIQDPNFMPLFEELVNDARDVLDDYDHNDIVDEFMSTFDHNCE